MFFVRENIREGKSWTSCLLVLGRRKHLKMVLMFYLCSVRKEIKTLIESLSTGEYRKIFHTDRNHVSLWDVWNHSSIKPNLNRNTFRWENNMGIPVSVSCFIFVILWGQLDKVATLYSVSVLDSSPLGRWKVCLRRRKGSKNGKVWMRSVSIEGSARNEQLVSKNLISYELLPQLCHQNN